LPGTTSGHVADQPHNLCGALRLPRIHARNTGETLAEDLAGARRIAAGTADCRPQFDRDTLPWKVVQVTEIATMPRVGAFSANRTGGLLLNVDD
jgi:hypothetical protein